MCTCSAQIAYKFVIIFLEVKICKFITCVCPDMSDHHLYMLVCNMDSMQVCMDDYFCSTYICTGCMYVHIRIWYHKIPPHLKQKVPISTQQPNND